MEQQLIEQSTGVAALGLDWKLFISQLVNFIILLVLLRLFAYQPILRVLHDRRKRIEQSLATAKLIEKQERELAEKERERLKRAKEESDEIIAEAKQMAEHVKQQVLEEMKLEREQDRQKWAKAMVELKHQTLEEAKKELAQLVAVTSTRVLQKIMTRDLNEKLTANITDEVKP